MMTLTHQVDRTVVIQATPAIVFAFLTETPRWAAWWGAGSEIDARPGGRMKDPLSRRHRSDGRGDRSSRAQTDCVHYGYASGKMIPPGGSRVTIRPRAVGAATRLKLTHEVAEEIHARSACAGWRYQFRWFANVVADAVNAGAASVATRVRRVAIPTRITKRTLSRIAVDDLRFRDRTATPMVSAIS